MHMLQGIVPDTCEQVQLRSKPATLLTASSSFSPMVRADWYGGSLRRLMQVDDEGSLSCAASFSTLPAICIAHHTHHCCVLSDTQQHTSSAAYSLHEPCTRLAHQPMDTSRL